MTRFMSTRGVASARAVFLVALVVAVLVPCWADAQRPDALPYAVTPGRTAGSEAAGASTPPTAAVNTPGSYERAGCSAAVGFDGLGDVLEGVAVLLFD